MIKELANGYYALDTEFEILDLQDFGRRPTTAQDIGALLTLIKHAPPGPILEIGTWTGKTTFELAVRNPNRKFFTVDFLENQVSDIEQGARCSRGDLCKHAKHLPNVTFVYWDSKKIPWGPMAEMGFALAFIDGDHSYEGVKADTELCMKTMKAGSIICWHDVARGDVFGISKYLKDCINDRFVFKRFNGTQIGFIVL